MLRGSARSFIVVLVAVAGFQLLVGGGTGMGDVVRSIASTLVGVLPLVFAGVCADLNQGVGSLWLQKPVSPVRQYLGRLAESAVAAAALPLLLVAGTALALTIGGSDEAGDVIRSLPAVALWVTVVVSVGFGISAWLPRAAKSPPCALLSSPSRLRSLPCWPTWVGSGRSPRVPSFCGFCRRLVCCTTFRTTSWGRRRFPLAKSHGRCCIPECGSALEPWASHVPRTGDWPEAWGDQGAIQPRSPLAAGCRVTASSTWFTYCEWRRPEGLRPAGGRVARSMLAG